MSTPESSKKKSKLGRPKKTEMVRDPYWEEFSKKFADQPEVLLQFKKPKCYTTNH